MEPVTIAGDLLRLVESQEQVATGSLVDNLTEQALLEDMIEATRPARRPGTGNLHYLLASPFRYPPLPHGSRFGARHEPSLLYGAKARGTLLAEAAYYRFVFWEAMTQPPPVGRLLTQHSVIRARYRSRRGLRLQAAPLSDHETLLKDPGNYRATQELGTAMRAAGVEAFEFVSARARRRGINVAMFEPTALACSRPLTINPWLCETTADSVTFSSTSRRALISFPLTQFLVGGRFPDPAR